MSGGVLTGGRNLPSHSHPKKALDFTLNISCELRTAEAYSRLKGKKRREGNLSNGELLQKLVPNRYAQSFRAWEVLLAILICKMTGTPRQTLILTREDTLSETHQLQRLPILLVRKDFVLPCTRLSPRNTSDKKPHAVWDIGSS